MSKPQRILTTVLWLCVVVFMMFFLASWAAVRKQGARADGEPQLTVATDAPAVPEAQMPPFSLTTQDGKPFTRDDLAGRAWVLDFVFTNCGGPCPLMTEKMASLQKKLPNPNVRFLSLTVDPERDTPPVLKEYARIHNADLSRWDFLTGSNDTIQQVARALLLPAQPTGDPTRIIHSEKFVLVDGHGKMRGFYFFKDDDAMSRLIADANQLAAEEGKPGTRP